MKTLKLFLALAGTTLWGAFALYMNDMNSASDLDHAAGLVRVAWIGVLASLWLVFWGWLTWSRRQEARWVDHLAMVVSVLWANSLVIDIGLPWLAYLGGWMWPSFLSTGLTVFLVLSGACIHLKVLLGQLRSGTCGLALASATLMGITSAFFSWAASGEGLHDLPYTVQVFM